MAFKFTSRRGETFYLHARQETRSDGRTELVHYFAPEVDPDEAVDALPAGYSVVEEGDAVRLVRSATAERHQARLQTMADPRARREAKRAARRERFEARTRPAKIDWMALALALGVDPDGGGMGSPYAQRALEQILGEENIRSAVEQRLNFEPGWAVAESVLRYIRSEAATDVAYETFRTSNGDRQIQAVALISEIAHPKALDWVDEFLHDREAVAEIGVSVLDMVLFGGQVDDDDPRVEPLLRLAEAHTSEHVRSVTANVRRYLAERSPSRTQS